MSADRTVCNPATGETITFLETSAETGGARVVAEIVLAPGGTVSPHSHRIAESFECLDGAFLLHQDGRESELRPGRHVLVEPHRMHGFRNVTDRPATLRVTATPAGDLDRILRTLCGLSRDGLLEPGRPPRHPLVMASLAQRGRYYEPPLPRWLHRALVGVAAPFGARACDRMIARYND